MSALERSFAGGPFVGFVLAFDLWIDRYPANGQAVVAQIQAATEGYGLELIVGKGRTYVEEFWQDADGGRAYAYFDVVPPLPVATWARVTMTADFVRQTLGVTVGSAAPITGAHLSSPTAPQGELILQLGLPYVPPSDPWSLHIDDMTFDAKRN